MSATRGIRLRRSGCSLELFVVVSDFVSWLRRRFKSPANLEIVFESAKSYPTKPEGETTDCLILRPNLRSGTTRIRIATGGFDAEKAACGEEAFYSELEIVARVVSKWHSFALSGEWPESIDFDAIDALLDHYAASAWCDDLAARFGPPRPIVEDHGCNPDVVHEIEACLEWFGAAYGFARRVDVHLYPGSEVQTIDAEPAAGLFIEPSAATQNRPSIMIATGGLDDDDDVDDAERVLEETIDTLLHECVHYDQWEKYGRCWESRIEEVVKDMRAQYSAWRVGMRWDPAPGDPSGERTAGAHGEKT